MSDISQFNSPNHSDALQMVIDGNDNESEQLNLNEIKSQPSRFDNTETKRKTKVQTAVNLEELI